MVQVNKDGDWQTIKTQSQFSKEECSLQETTLKGWKLARRRVKQRMESRVGCEQPFRTTTIGGIELTANNEAEEMDLI